jgi:ATP-dependent RNA helicase RhlE
LIRTMNPSNFLSETGPAGGATPQETAPAAVPAFADLGLSASALAAVAAAGYDVPTPVQARAIPAALAGRDVIACAATGTGKTAAFALPILDRLSAHEVAPGRRGPRTLVLAPTRELVQQITQSFAQLSGGRRVRCAYVVGGLAMDSQARALREGREVIVATPGRLLDHLDRGNVRLDGVEILVLDEADRMLDLGFRPQLEAILGALPQQRQTLLFSATIGREVADFAARCLQEPVRIEIARTGTIAPRAEQRVFHVEQRTKPDLLLALLAGDEATTLVFTRTKHRAERLAKVLDRAGHRVARLHGDRSQAQRQAALHGFRTGEVRVLVATDVAARGLDVADIAHVVNFDLSLVPEDHVHRVGRTARAAASGLASSFCSPEELGLLRAIERFTRKPIVAATVPEGIAPAPVPAPVEPKQPSAEAMKLLHGRPQGGPGAGPGAGGQQRHFRGGPATGRPQGGVWRKAGRPGGSHGPRFGRPGGGAQHKPTGDGASHGGGRPGGGFRPKSGPSKGRRTNFRGPGGPSRPR